MFCSKCGAKIDDGVNFCSECGSSVKQEAERGELNSPLVSQVETSAYDSKKLSLLASQDSCNTFLIMGLVFAMLNFVPYLNCITGIIAVVVTIIGMCKVVSFCDEYAQYDNYNESSNIGKIVRKLRFHYIVSMVCGFFGGILSVIMIAIGIAISEKDSSSIGILLSIVGGIILLVLIVYSVVVQITCLVKWFKVRDFITTAGLVLKN
ncbi:MAG: zinc-ribbon domain-containing protein [Succinivibrionaceae bacterium]